MALTAMLVLSGCGGGETAKKPAASAAKPQETVTTETQAVVDETSAPQAVSAGQLEFYTERYISGPERLQRRQQRIEQELTGGGASDAG